jgi:hypothetical protein
MHELGKMTFRQNEVLVPQPHDGGRDPWRNDGTKAR